MSERVLAAAEKILDKWHAGYRDLLMPMFDGHHVFGEVIEAEDVREMDEAIAEARGREPRWTYDEESISPPLSAGPAG